MGTGVLLCANKLRQASLQLSRIMCCALSQLGYELEGPYMVKAITPVPLSQRRRRAPQQPPPAPS